MVIYKRMPSEASISFEGNVDHIEIYIIPLSQGHKMQISVTYCINNLTDLSMKSLVNSVLQ